MKKQNQQFNEMSEAFSDLNRELKDLAFDKEIEEKKNKISDVLADYTMSDIDFDESDLFVAMYGNNSDSVEIN